MMSLMSKRRRERAIKAEKSNGEAGPVCAEWPEIAKMKQG
jgi:hypothetical protein